MSENLKINPAVLSRFDLTFILLDKPDEALDELLSDHVISVRVTSLVGFCLIIQYSWYEKIHMKGSRGSRLRATSNLDAEYSESTLESRLKVRPHEFDHLPIHCLRKYIAYAREYCHPECVVDFVCILFLSLATANLIQVQTVAGSH